MALQAKVSEIGRQIDDLVPDLGKCQIGAWTESVDSQSLKTITPPRISREFKGRIDEVMVFHRPLSESEVADLYRLGNP